MRQRGGAHGLAPAHGFCAALMLLVSGEMPAEIVPSQSELNLLREQQELEFEKKVNESLRDALKTNAPQAVPRAAAIRGLISSARLALQGAVVF
jgi:hypothetical protein